MSTRYLTESEVSARTHISLATLRRWRLERRGPAYSKFGSLVRYGEDELIQWEQAQPHGGDDPTRRFDVKPERNGTRLRRAV
jgi:predicted DNA-binding transcriptional regulator AlpA